MIPDASLSWICNPSIFRGNEGIIIEGTTEELKHEGVEILASIPLVRNGLFAGVLIIASKDARKFESKKIGLIQAFGNQISVALQNASLYEQLKQSEHLYADLYDYSPDMEYLEVVGPADFTTVEVATGPAPVPEPIPW